MIIDIDSYKNNYYYCYYVAERRPKFTRRRPPQRKTNQSSGQDSQGEERGVSDGKTYITNWYPLVTFIIRS